MSEAIESSDVIIDGGVSQDGSQLSPAVKRKYVTRACDLCKRKKIKCNGEEVWHPCRTTQPKEALTVWRSHVRNVLSIAHVSDQSLLPNFRQRCRAAQCDFCH